MKRDNEYLRDLLLEIEESEEHLYLVVMTLGAGLDQEKKWFHVQLLCDQGYLFQESKRAYRLTAQGLDFIESVRDEGIWNRTKAAIGETGGNVTLEILSSLARGFLKKKIEKHTGIEI